AAFRTATVASDGTWSLTLSTPLATGQVVQVAQTVAGVTGPFSDPATVYAAPPAPHVDRPIIAGSTSVTGAGTGGASVTLFVGAAVLRQIVISPAPTASVVQGVTRAFTVHGIFSDGVVQAPLSGVVWSSSAQGVASIGAAGVATGVSPGPTTIMASRSAVTSAGTLLTVTAPV